MKVRQREALLLLLCGSLAVGCTRSSLPTDEPLGGDPGYKTTTTVEDIMRSMVDPAADAIWDAVVVDVTPNGTVTTVPETDEDWVELRKHAVTLVESTNLLLMEGRRIAAPGSRADMPGVDLEPDAIEVLLREDRPTWRKYVENLHASAVDVLNAVDELDVDALLEAGDRLDLACEQCHVHFWYPSLAAGQADQDKP